MLLLRAIFICLWVSVHSNQNCSDVICDPVPKHYEELNCIPKIKSGECCPSSFDCSAFLARDQSKCYFGDKVFAEREEFHNSDIEESCTIGCSCRKDDTFASFHCTHIDCPEFFGDFESESGKKCIRQYEKKGCCSKGSVCGADIEKLAQCKFNGRIYYEGQKIDSDKKCYSCMCEKGFEDKPAENNPHCHKINCLIDLHYADKFSRGCIPIYYKTEDCCPIDFRCPDEQTTVVKDKTRTSIDSTLKCSFGNLKMSLGDYLSPQNDYDQCTICTCKHPPHPTCIKTC